jgi:hypothetical protein
MLSLALGMAASESVLMADAKSSDPLPAIPASFPLRVAASRRYLEDNSGKPFLIQGEAAWSLIAQLTREKAALYFEDRRSRGFNAILVSLIEHKFATRAPANIYGQPPFLRPGDFTSPNELYFVHADWVIENAAEAGILVLLVPCYMGSGGGPEGWYQDMQANGTGRLHHYGQYLGRRYGKFNNILWVHGADYDPPTKAFVTAVAEGIREFDPAALHSAHCAPETSAAEFWRSESWLSLNSIYTYRPAYAAALMQYGRSDHMPFFLIETTYENEHGLTDELLRAQAYYALLSGAAGQIFGNNPIWHFDGPGLFPSPDSWQHAMASRGSQSMTHLVRLFSAMPWWMLQPDSGNVFLIDGLGSGFDHAVAALAVDRTFGVVYLPKVCTLILNLGQLVGPKVAARWYDPSLGQFFEVKGSPFPTRGSQAFTPEPGRNDTGGEDWALVLKSTP